MIAEDIGRLALILMVCWTCGIGCLLLAVLLWPFVRSRLKSPSRAACYALGMSHDENENLSFRAWLLQPIIQRIEHILAKSLADLNVSIAANTSATNNAVAAFAAGVSGDFTAQASAIDANTAKLAAIAPGGVTNPGGGVTLPLGAITANPAVITLAAGVPSQSVTLTQANGQPNNYNAVSTNTAIATVSPASGPGPFTITRIGAGTGATVTFTDAQNNVLTLPVSAS